ncbi:MAG TPA: cell division protein [Nitratifractor sp.]|nr:cell division protein [Nitratifractor sp.]
MRQQLYLVTLSLMLFSIVAIYSLSVYPGLYLGVSSYYFLLRDSVAVIIALLVMTYIANLEPTKSFKVIGFTLFIVFLAIMIAMLFMPESLVKSVKGAKRWIKFSSVSLAPAEFFKYGFLFFIAWSLERKHKMLLESKGLKSEIVVIAPYFLLLGAVILILAVAQKDLGQSALLIFTMLALLFLSGRSKKFFVALGSVAVVSIVSLIMVAPHRIDRFKGWWVGVQNSILSLLPDSIATSMRVTDTTEALPIVNARYALESGGLFGQGLGSGQYKLGYISEVHTDFIFAGLGEEIGFIGLFLLLMLYAYIILLIVKIGNSLESLSQKYFTYGVAIILFLSLLINLYGVTGIVPEKGIAVPILSYGGSQLVATAVAIGMVLMLAKGVKK